MRKMHVILASTVFLGASNQAVLADQDVKGVTLICNPVNQLDSASSTAITIKWKGNIMGIVDTDKFHKHGEYFEFNANTQLWDSYCWGKINDPESGYNKNYCHNAGFISFFDGSTLVMNGTELSCRRVEQPSFK